MQRFNTGYYSYDLHYYDEDMSISMKLLKARLCQLLNEKGIDANYRKAYFVFFTKGGGDTGYEFHLPNSSYRKGSNQYLLHEPIKQYYKKGVNISIDEVGFVIQKNDDSFICKHCKGKKFIRENEFGFIEPCQSCNSNYHLPFIFHS